MEPTVERIIVRDSSGQYHLRLKVKGKTYSQDDTNDDPGEIVSELPEDIDSAQWCRRCFPEMHDPRPANAQEE